METSDLKSKVRQNLPKFPTTERPQASSAIKEQLLNWPEFHKSRKIAFYQSLNDEICLDFLFECDKQFYLPKYDTEKGIYESAFVANRASLIVGRFGIREPSMACPVAEKNEIDLWLVPALAFDRQGNRLGRGAGFYDRLLQNERGIKAGIIYRHRLIENIPAESWDIKMNFVLTDKKIIKCNNN